MILWRIADPGLQEYATAALRGTWSEGPTTACPECGASRQARIQPLVVEWEPGSDLVGDFTWPSFGSDAAITRRVVDGMGQAASGFRPGPVEMVQDPKIRRPSRADRRVRSRVWLPYDGPELFDLWVVASKEIDRERSTARLVRTCSICSAETWEVEGVEERKSRWSQKHKRLVTVIEPRKPGSGLIIREADLEGAGVFRTVECPGWILCTEAVRELLEREAYTNVRFMEVGETS